MGRDLKFRAWDKNTSEWVYAELDTSRALSTVRLVNSSEWLQYTGLKDKNGVDIYEGDIVQSSGVYNYEVKWNTYDAHFCYGEEAYHLNDGSRLEVIGNVWENGDLLNDSK